MGIFVIMIVAKITNVIFYKMSTQTVKQYISPEMGICEIVVEAPIASSLANAGSNFWGVDDATVEDWGIL